MKINGIVGKGRQEGRKIGFPTANIITQQNLEDLEFGIYAGKIKVFNNWYIAAISYGNAPTFGVEKITLEAHILDFDVEVYGQKVELEIQYLLRPIENYSSLEQLKVAIQKDCDRARKVVLLS